MKPLKFLRLSAVLTFVALTVFWVGSTVAAGPARSAGCKTEHFLITHLAGPYKAATGQVIQPGATGNKKAILLFAEGKLAFAYTCKPHEMLAKKFKIDPTVSAGWTSVVIARDPIVVVANPSAGITNLNLDQLKALFTGSIANWSEVGGSELGVSTAYMDESVDSGVVTVFKETTVGKKGTLDPAAKMLPSPKQVGYYTKSTAGAVTFMSLNSYKPEFGQIVSINDITPDKDSVVNGTYPLSVTYHIVYDQKNGEVAESFLGFLGSAEGQALINEVMVVVPLSGAAIQ